MISTKGRYALRIMIDLASQNSDAFIPLKDIAERQNISKKYLEIIIKDLVEGGLLDSLSGKGGGYKLKRKPEEYSVGEIIELTEGSRFHAWPKKPKNVRELQAVLLSPCGRSTEISFTTSFTAKNLRTCLKNKYNHKTRR